MESLMDDALHETIKGVNSKISLLLEEARGALRGERDFGVADVRRLREPVGEMDSIVAQSFELRRLHPEIAVQLEFYKLQLRDLQIVLQQIRMMLLTRQAGLNSSQNNLTAVSLWVSAFNQTR
jgi:hypothetical protein